MKKKRNMEEDLDFMDEIDEAAPYMPYTLDLFDDSSNFRTKFKFFFEHVQALGTLTTDYLKRCAEEDDDDQERGEDEVSTFVSSAYERNRLRRIFNAWQESFVVCMENMREIRHHTLPKSVFGVDADGKQRKLKTTFGMHVFCELTRLNVLLNRPAILGEQNNIDTIPLEELTTDNYVLMLSLKRTLHPLWISVVSTYDISALYETKEDPDAEVEALLVKMKAMWPKPIMQYTQSEVCQIIFFLTQQLNEIPTLPTADGISLMDEYRSIFNAVWLRVGYIMQELHDASVMDDPVMRQPVIDGYFSFSRNFATFCSFYLGEIMRRFFYYDAIARNRITDPALANAKQLGAAVFAWITQVVDTFADEAFEDLYHSVNSDGYQFVGDDGWFKFMWPQKIHSRGACITAFRPHLYKRFFSEAQLNKRAVLNSAKTSHVARLFVFKAIDEYIKIKVPNVHWINAVVTANGDIEMSAYKLDTEDVSLAPVLLQVFSSYWAYDKGRVWVCDDIFESIGVWFWLLMTRYNCVLFDRDLSEIVKQVVPPHLYVDPHTVFSQHDQEFVVRQAERPPQPDATAAAAARGQLFFEL